MKKKEAILLLPCVLLAVLAAVLYIRPKTGTDVKGKLFPQTALEIKQIQFRPIKSQEPGYPHYQVTISLGYKGWTPSWWRKDEPLSLLQNPRFVDTKGKVHKWEMYNGGYRGFNDESKCHIFEYQVEMQPQFKLREHTFAGVIAMKKAGVLRFKTPTSG